jgi:hypothetical protein
MVNESTNQTMDQHLIISYCILNLKGKEAAIVSFVELSVIENYGGGYIPCNKEHIGIIIVEY